MNTATIDEIRVRCDGGGETLLLVPGSELGAGGQATVYPVPGRPDRVAKIYHDPAPEQELKLRRMIAHPPAGASAGGSGAGIFAWPLELLRGEDGGLVGFLLPRVDGRLRVFELYNPATRRERAPLFHHGLLHRAARNLAAAFDRLHEAGFVVGDVNESNILVGEDGRVVLIDTDSFQVRDPECGTVYRCPVGRPEFTPPELRERSFAETDRAPEHDRFGLGVLVFQMLMEGTHPFAGRFRGKGEPPSVQERIAAGHFPYARRTGVPLEPPRTAPPPEVLDPGVRELVRRCFEDGHRDPAARPHAAEWRDTLEAAEAALATCGRNEQHRYGAHLGDCPWCERARKLEGRDPFPSAAAVRSGEHRPVPARAPRRPAPAGAPRWQGPSAAPRPRFRAMAQAGARTLPAPLRNGWFLAALLVALVGTVTAALPPLSLALVAGGLTVLGRRTALSKQSTQWGLAFTMIFLGLGLALGDGPWNGTAGGRPEPSSPALELPPVPSADASSVAFAYAPEALDRLPILQDTAALLAAAALLSQEYVPDGEEPEFQLRFVLDSSGQAEMETVQLTPDPSYYAMDMFRTRLAWVRFRPGELGGRSVRTEMRVTLRGANGRVSPDFTSASWNPGMERVAPIIDVADAEVKPQLLNAGEVQALLAEMYPPLLRDAGITGQAHLKFVVDAGGAVDPGSIVVVSATHDGFAEASAVVVASMRFSPARVDGRAVPVLVQIPVSWTLEPD
ncbi:MAG: TonB family protein [Longimicrobiaceae bacterium]